MPLNGSVSLPTDYAPSIALADETMYHGLGSNAWLLIMVYENSFSVYWCRMSSASLASLYVDWDL